MTATATFAAASHELMSCLRSAHLRLPVCVEPLLSVGLLLTLLAQNPLTNQPTTTSKWPSKAWKSTATCPCTSKKPKRLRPPTSKTSLASLRNSTTKSALLLPLSGCRSNASLQSRLWHQLTLLLATFAAVPSAAPFLVPVYDEFVVDWVKKMNQLSLVQYVAKASRTIKGTCNHPPIYLLNHTPNLLQIPNKRSRSSPRMSTVCTTKPTTVPRTSWPRWRLRT